jgi:hypothetical protein
VDLAAPTGWFGPRSGEQARGQAALKAYALKPDWVASGSAQAVRRRITLGLGIPPSLNGGNERDGAAVPAKRERARVAVAVGSAGGEADGGFDGRIL